MKWLEFHSLGAHAHTQPNERSMMDLKAFFSPRYNNVRKVHFSIPFAFVLSLARSLTPSFTLLQIIIPQWEWRSASTNYTMHSTETLIGCFISVEVLDLFPFFHIPRIVILFLWPKGFPNEEILPWLKKKIWQIFPWNHKNLLPLITFLNKMKVLNKRKFNNLGNGDKKKSSFLELYLKLEPSSAV